MPETRLAGSVAVVTGGASGIGRALAERFAAEGAKAVIVADRDAAGAQAVAATITGGLGIGLDVTDEDAVKAAAEFIDREVGPIDIWCSNAGIGGGPGLGDDATWETTFKVHVLAHVYVARHVLPLMLARGSGHIMITASAAGLLTEMDTAPYSVTKHGSVALAEWLAIQHGDAGINFSCLCPQGVVTAMTAGFGAESAVMAAGGFIQPSEVADAVVAAWSEGRFLILPHPQVAEYEQRRANDRDRWLNGMRRTWAKLKEYREARHLAGPGHPHPTGAARQFLGRLRRGQSMDFTYDDRTEELRSQVAAFMDEFVYPAETVMAEWLEANPDAWSEPPIVHELQREARKRGLWNLFLAGHPEGAGLTNLQYAPLAELMGRSAIGAAAFNCAAPDTGNMEVLAEWGTEEQKDRWLKPLLDAQIRSAFCMTEPDVASSDATNISTRITADGDEYVINGRKWWSSGAMSPECAILIVMGKSNPDADKHRQQSMILVPRDTPGITVRRGMRVFGNTDASHGGHAEITFTDVRVPASNLIAGEGMGFAIAQARLGPGRIHHCMRLIGASERALELMCTRALGRVAFGRPLAEQGVIGEWIADARVRIEMMRLLVLKTAYLMDTVGNRGAHTEIQAIKIAVPTMAEWILDKAIQTHGAGGVSQDFPLASQWAYARSLRLADGPDEVHKRSLAHRELKKYTSK